jgi:hypothetical protein
MLAGYPCAVNLPDAVSKPLCRPRLPPLPHELAEVTGIQKGKLTARRTPRALAERSTESKRSDGYADASLVERC